MEMRVVFGYTRVDRFLRFIAVAALLCSPLFGYAQPVKKYSLKDGRMLITLEKNLPGPELKDFIRQFDLGNLALDRLLQEGFMDSLKRAGWKMETNTDRLVVISKPLLSYDAINDPADRILLTGRQQLVDAQFPAVSNLVKYGYNQFRGKQPFTIKDSVVYFFLKGRSGARSVMLAGSFNNWDPGARAMQKTDSGWIAGIKLRPGKYWYKFIVDGKWITDPDNRYQENDGMGNTNSVFFYTNTVFRLTGYVNAKNAWLSGSFNNWHDSELEMTRTATGWELPLYLSEGTHTYRFIADRRWMEDPGNPDKFPNEFGEFNSVIRIGRPHVFRLTGYAGAGQVVLSGSFNDWRVNELFMQRSQEGWELPYVLGPGNYQYRFLVDGKMIPDPANPPPHPGEDRPSILVLNPNYTFRLKGFESAGTICLAGEFNNWSPDGFPMKKRNGEWVLDIHLYPGKHLYKFVVDGQWIRDPANGLWEQNEEQTGNSVLWLEKTDLRDTKN